MPATTDPDFPVTVVTEMTGVVGNTSDRPPRTRFDVTARSNGPHRAATADSAAVIRAVRSASSSGAFAPRCRFNSGRVRTATTQPLRVSRFLGSDLSGFTLATGSA